MAATMEYDQMSFEDFIDEGLSDSSSEQLPQRKKKSPLQKKTAVKNCKKSKDNDSKKQKSENRDKTEKKEDTNKHKKDLKKEKKFVNAKEKIAENLANDKNLQQIGKVQSAKTHKRQLEKLKENDPEFYKFLEKEDKELLDFQASDDEDSELEGDESPLNMSESDESDEDPERGNKFHKPPAKLEVDSEDSEASDEEPSETKARKSQNVTRLTQTLVKELETSVQQHPSIRTLRPIIQAFKAAVHSGDDENTSRFKVEDSIVFNAVVRLALTNVLPTLSKILKLPDEERSGKKVSSPASSPCWKKVSHDVKSYVMDILKMLGVIKEPAIVNVVLRHVYRLVPYYLIFPKVTKAFIKTLINIWSEGDESSRVLAFLSIIKLVRSRQDKLLDPCLKQMYMAYVKNSKFTSPTTLPLINFMQRSMVEVYALDTEVTYQHAFVYIRQLAIHLRNAMTVKKKETLQAVYNWQFVHSLGLWSRLVSQLAGDETVLALIYPLVQIIIGTVNLIPSPRYYPLRFHCVRMLNTISGSANVFIPVLPLLLEVLEMTDFNKKPKSVSFKPFNFAVILKLSKTQLQEKWFREGVIDQLFELFLENFHVHAHSVGFPELTFPAVLQIKDFLKKCKVANFAKQMKQILDLVKGGANCVVERRKRSTLDLRDDKAVDAWELRCNEEGTPLTKYYATWRKARDRELTIGAAARDQIVGESHLPEIIREKPRTLDSVPSTTSSGAAKRTLPKADRQTMKELAAVFDQSNSEDDDIQTSFLPKHERPKKDGDMKSGQKKKKSTDEESESEYSEFDDEELELLAGSADDEEGEEDMEMDEDGDEETMESSDDESDEADDDDDDDVADIVEDFKFSDEDQ